MLAQEQTRHYMNLMTRGSVTRDELLEAIKCTGVFSPLVALLMDRLAKSVDECNRVWEEKSGWAAEAAEARAARRAREREAAGTCIICLDEKPNIATLCCGKAIHLQCLAIWLGGRNSCPVCRQQLPSIVRAAAPQVAAGAAAASNSAANDQENRIIVNLLAGDDNEISLASTGESSGSSSEDTEDTTDMVPAPSGVGDFHFREEEDEGTTNISPQQEEGTSGDVDESDTTNAMAVTPTPRNYCASGHCLNRPAVDCSNSCCGRCCVLGGEYLCLRHNT
jgi:hypothetical protein